MKFVIGALVAIGCACLAYYLYENDLQILGCIVGIGGIALGGKISMSN